VRVSRVLHRPSEKMCNHFVVKGKVVNSSAAFYLSSCNCRRLGVLPYLAFGL
jgi:hypothetical protein